jgi:hypothetical protein
MESLDSMQAQLDSDHDEAGFETTVEVVGEDFRSVVSRDDARIETIGYGGYVYLRGFDDGESEWRRMERAPGIATLGLSVFVNQETYLLTALDMAAQREIVDSRGGLIHIRAQVDHIAALREHQWNALSRLSSTSFCAGSSPAPDDATPCPLSKDEFDEAFDELIEEDYEESGPTSQLDAWIRLRDFLVDRVEVLVPPQQASGQDDETVLGGRISTAYSRFNEVTLESPSDFVETTAPPPFQ